MERPEVQCDDGRWVRKPALNHAQFDLLKKLIEERAFVDGEFGLTKDQLCAVNGDYWKKLKQLTNSDPDWARVIRFPGSTGPRIGYRIL
jgi:hypothetical protein